MYMYTYIFVRTYKHTCIHNIYMYVHVSSYSNPMVFFFIFISSSWIIIITILFRSVVFTAGLLTIIVDSRKFSSLTRLLVNRQSSQPAVDLLVVLLVDSGLKQPLLFWTDKPKRTRSVCNTIFVVILAADTLVYSVSGPVSEH